MNEPSDHPTVPGVRLLHPLPDAGAGDVRSGERELSGDPVTVRLLELPPGDPQRARAVLDGERLVALRHPHLVGVDAVVDGSEGPAVVMAPLEVVTTLERMLGERRRLPAGEVVTLGIPLAQALAAAHRAGVVHGRLTPADVLIDPAGRPVLAGAGAGGLLGAAGTQADDVRDLGRLLVRSLGEAVDDAATAVALAVGPALIDEPDLRPAADDLATALQRTTPPVPPVPLRIRTPPRPLPRPQPGRGRRRLRAPLRLRGPAAVVVLFALAAAAGFVGWRSVQPGAAGEVTRPGLAAIDVAAVARATASMSPAAAPPAAAPPAAAPPTAAPPATAASDAAPAASSTRWREVLAGLDAARARSFEQGSRVAMTASDAPASAALRADLALLDVLAGRGVRASGLRPEIVDLRVESEGTDVTVLATFDRLGPYRFLDGAGRVAGQRPGSLRRHRVTLVRIPAGWRVALVEPARS